MNKITTTTLPDFFRSRPMAVGFDRMLDMLNDIEATGSGTGYPPYNIIKTDESNYLIELAVAGFNESQLTVTQNANQLTVEGASDEMVENDSVEYLYKGISGRRFVRQFTLADHVFVDGAQLENGILTVRVRRELPEELQPRQIEIKRIGK